MTPRVALRFDGVRKRYGNSPPALDGLSFHIPAGTITGFIGPNGAGKTTTFSVVSGFLPPDAGTVDILGGGPFDPWRLKGRLGVLPQDAELPGRHSPLLLLAHLGRLQGMADAEATREARAKLEIVRLTARQDDRIDALSHGMRRRVAVASAMLGRPELVLLDEPTAGLDPVEARALRDALASLRGATTVVISSHNLLELEKLCDHVVMVDRGRCVREGSIVEVTGQQHRLEWTLARAPTDPKALVEALSEHGVRLGRPDGTGAVELTVTTGPGADLDAVSLTVMSTLSGQDVAIREMRRGQSLEDRFVRDTAR